MLSSQGVAAPDQRQPARLRSKRGAGVWTKVHRHAHVAKALQAASSRSAAGSTASNDITIISRIASSGGFGFLSLTNTTTNPNSMTLAALDATNNPTPPDNHESGDGVLARVTVTAVGASVTDLVVGGPLGGSDGFPDVIINSDTTGLNAIPATTALRRPRTGVRRRMARYS